jgi:hypothetical protein
MSTRRPDEDPKDYEIPCEMFEVSTFNASSKIPPEKLAGVPVGGFEVDQTLLESTTFDAGGSAPMATEVLTFDIDLPLGLSDAEAVVFVTEFVRKLDAAHRSRGGSGLQIEKVTLTVDGVDLCHSDRKRIVKVLVPAA